MPSDEILKEAGRMLGEKMAECIDIDIWWLTLEGRYRDSVEALIRRRIRLAKPWWIPKFIWRRHIDKIETI